MDNEKNTSDDGKHRVKLAITREERHAMAVAASIHSVSISEFVRRTAVAAAVKIAERAAKLKNPEIM